MEVGNERRDGGGTEVDNEIVRPLITRVDDRVRVSLSGGNSNIENIRETRRTLEGEIYQAKEEDKIDENTLAIYSENKDLFTKMEETLPGKLHDDIINHYNIFIDNVEPSNSGRSQLSDYLEVHSDYNQNSRGSGGGGIDVDNEIVRTLITRVDDRVRISLSGGNSNIEKIRDTRSTIFVGVPNSGIISRSRQEYLGGDNVIKNRSLVRLKYSEPRLFNPRQYQTPSLFVVVNNNNVVAEFVKRDKWTRKANPFYMNSEFLLENDILPSEINRKLKTNGEGK
ncbi:hypothetical protein FXO38_25811 [Capsicum annuum]|nr:hypothetical protein FXO38_25811 [Capsicum annuum]